MATFLVFDKETQTRIQAVYCRKIDRYIIGAKEYTEKQFEAKFELINDKQIKLFN